MRNINLIIIHCAATTPVMDIGADVIRKWHVDDNGWSDIGYHHVIRRNGLIEPGREHKTPGAHAKGYNEKSIGICMVGGIDMESKPHCNFTRHQWAALPNLINDLLQKFPGAQVIGHHDVNPHKSCPGFNVAAYWYGKITD